MNHQRYTKHGLTSEQVRQLSQYWNGRRDEPSGTSGVCLAENDRAEAIARWDGDPDRYGRPVYTISREQAGEIVAEARKEGW